MKLKTARTSGAILLAVGVVMLITGIILALLLGSATVTAICLTGSIVVNTAAITLLRHKRSEKRRNKR